MSITSPRHSEELSRVLQKGFLLSLFLWIEVRCKASVRTAGHVLICQTGLSPPVILWDVATGPRETPGAGGGGAGKVGVGLLSPDTTGVLQLWQCRGGTLAGGGTVPR